MGPRAVLLGLGLAVSVASSGGCVLSRRQVMLVVTTDTDCNIFDRVQIRITRGTDPIPTFDQTFLRADCPAVGIAPPPVVPLRLTMPGENPALGEFRLGIVDSRRSDDHVRIELTARTSESQVFTTAAETSFVDGTTYAVPVRLALVCAQAVSMPCPSEFTCRPHPESGLAACGSVFRAPGSLGTFQSTQAAQVTVDE
jgi:hypothetical protein